MSTIHQSRRAVSAFAAVLMLAVATPTAVHGEEQDLALAPASVPSWDETSGYGVVEALRAEPDLYVAPAGITADAASGSGSVEANRVTTAQHALQAGDLGSMQEEVLAAIVATGASWDDTSGYGAVEASRATIGHPVSITTVESSRVHAAQQALLSGDLGSMQEEALTTVVATGAASDEAALLAQFRAVELSSSSLLGTAQHETASCDAIS
jgi:hypothetical protein